jgi:hypothetical protein
MGVCLEQLLTFPFGCYLQANALEMEPLPGASLGIASDHLTVAHLVAEAVSRLISIWFVVIVLPSVVSPSGVFPR